MQVKAAFRYGLMAVAMLSLGASVEAQEGGRVFPSGTPISLDEYGLSFIPADDMRQIERSHTRKHIEFMSYDEQGELTDIDIEIVDRFSFSSLQLGNFMLSTFEEGGIDLRSVHGGEIDKGKVRGAFMQGTLPSGREALVITLMHIDTADAFIISIHSRQGDLERAYAIADTISLDPPADKIVR